ncbi:MAG: hypothetical protein WCG10_00885 [Chlamydiota bacterium]
MVHPITMVPVEIWRKIFDYSDVEDIKKFGATCQLGLKLVIGYFKTNLDKDRLAQFSMYRPRIYLNLNSSRSLQDHFGGYKCHYVQVINMEHMPSLSIKHLNQMIQFFPNISEVKMPLKFSNPEKLLIDTRWDKLAKLSYHKTHVVSQVTMQWGAFPKLTSLTFKDAIMTKQSLEAIGTITRLEKLIINHSRGISSDQYLKPLKNLKDLREISLMGIKTFEGRCFQYLKNLHKLTDVNLAGAVNIEDKFLGHFDKLKLKKLDFSRCKNLTDVGIKKLERINTLEELNLSYCRKITDTTLQSVAFMTELRILNIAGCNWISDDGLQSLKHLIQLEELDVTGLNEVTYQGIAYLDKCLNMKKVVLSECIELTDEVFDTIQKWTHLEKLDISRCSRLTDIGIAKLKHCKNLKNVVVTGCSLLTKQSVIEVLPLKCLIIFL